MGLQSSFARIDMASTVSSAVLISSFTLWNFFLDGRSLLDVCDYSGFEHTLRRSMFRNLYEVKFLSLVFPPQSYEVDP